MFLIGLLIGAFVGACVTIIILSCITVAGRGGVKTMEQRLIDADALKVSYCAVPADFIN